MEEDGLLPRSTLLAPNPPIISENDLMESDSSVIPLVVFSALVAVDGSFVTGCSENKEYAKFQHNGLENTTELEIMFVKIVATGETAWTPAASPVFPKQQDVRVEYAVDLDEGSGDSDEVMATQIEKSNEKRKKDIASCSIKGKGKKVKLGVATYMQRQLDHLCDAVESYTSVSLTESSKKSYEAPASSIEECMDVLLTLPGVEDGGELFMLGTRLFMKREYREMFKSIKSVNSKLSWLKQELEREKFKLELEREKLNSKRQ